MSKKIIYYYILIIFLGILTGGVCGFIYAYYHPMDEISGYWKTNYFFSTPVGLYHINTHVHINGRTITLSSDLYDQKSNLKINQNSVYTIIDISDRVFSEKSESFITDKVQNDETLDSLFKAPFSISRPTFYFLDENTVLVDQSQGLMILSARLWQRSR
ncbi:hypothetical protein [Candidatus Hamiltonella defensa]|uniref:hypothetical protein n=1 Tax=Candidatus Williamhamiltonella defendens TaxID=138072 RepID=UPI000C1E4B57|nr:hypothetical protein [Candidatus Hamiltonella defensa]